MKPLRQIRSWAAGQDSLEIGQQVQDKEQAGLGTRSKGLPRLLQLPRTTSLLTLRKCELGAGELLCWDLGVRDPLLVRNGSLFLLQGKKWGFVSSQLDFSSTSLSMYFDALAPSLSVRVQCLCASYRLPPPGFKHLPSRLGVDGKTKIFCNC